MEVLQENSEFDYALWDLQRRRSKQDFFYFVDRVLRLKEYVNDYRLPLGLAPLQDYGWHIKHWCHLPHQYHKIHSRAPREYWKSSIWCIGFLAWRALFEDPMYAISITHDLAKEKLFRLKDLIEKRPFFNPPDNALRKLVPGKINPTGRLGWGDEQIRFSNGAKIDIAGFRTASRGPHPRTIVIDDPHGETQNFSMEFAWDLFRGTIRPMLPEGGYLVLVGTTFALNDLHHQLEDNPLFKPPDGYQEILPAVLEWNTKETLWPAWMTWEQLMQRRAELGVLIFDREYQNIALSEEASLFPYGLYSSCFDPVATLSPSYSGPLPVFSGWDLAISTTEEADFTVGFTVALDEFGNRKFLDIFREKGIGYSSQWAAIVSTWERYHPTIVGVEANAYQRALPDELAQYTDIPVEPFITGSEKHSMEVGLMSLRKLFENKKYQIPRGDERSRQLTDMLGIELQGLTFREGKVISAAAKDDMPMALWICEKAIAQYRERGGWFGMLPL